MKAQQVATFTLPRHAQGMSQIIMKGSGKQTILIALESELKLYSLTGTELKAFQDHGKSITSIWVVYTVTVIANFCSAH